MLAEDSVPFQAFFCRVERKMTSAKRQKVITIETHQQTLIRSNGKIFVAWCEACGAETLMLMPEQSAIVCSTTQREIFRSIENGELHFIETTAGVTLICRNSLEDKNYKTKGA